MKRLNDLILRNKPVSITGNVDINVLGLTFDSREVKKDYVFFAIKGELSDGHNYIEQAIANQATVIVCSKLPEILNHYITYLIYQNTSEALASFAAAFYDYPSEKLKLVGVTGTNGKTTIATLLFKLFRSLNYNVGLLSTITNYINEQQIESTHTTPDSLKINSLLAQMVEANCEYCFIEVSSHSVVQKRIDYLKFAGAIFTNLTHDHLDYHKDFISYRNAKKTFFDNLSESSFALSNCDDKNGAVMLQNTKANKYFYSLQKTADYRATILENTIDGLLLKIENKEVHFMLKGAFNAYNLLAVYAAARLLNQESIEILSTMSTLNPVDGRFDVVKNKKNICAIVDYAHTPDAVNNVLKTVEQIKKINQQLIVVIGAGGNRDKTKRPIMSSIAAKYADKLILTSDNPRNEDPLVILDEMKKGLSEQELCKTLIISDRKEAIRTACMLAQSNDLLVVVGKGHEKYQEINGVKYYFDDKEIIEEFLKN